MIDYEKRYNEALERAKHALDCDKAGLVTTDRVLIESMFPELQESEDEKIRKALIDYFDDAIKADVNPLQSYGTHPNKVIDWLEKQKAMDKDIIFRPLAGTDIIAAANQAIEKIEIGKEVVLAFNGAYIPVNGKTVAEICNEYFSWVEKQGEQKAIGMKSSEESLGVSSKEYNEIVNECLYGESKPTDKVEPKFKVGDIIINIHYRWDGKHRIREITDGKYIFDSGSYIGIKEQNSWELADKVEPKFKVGDWVLYSGDHYEGVRHITKIDENGYYIERNGLPHGIIPFNHEICMRLWTIQDAKDGDVLAGSKNDVILMFRGIGNTEWDDVIDYHCYYDCYHKDFIVQEDVKYWGNIENNQLKPATKEQRDLLFSKMKEAGYEWNAEKKELKKIVAPQPKFKVGDWIANDYCTGKVIALTDDAYLLDSGQGIPFSCEHNTHLWTIRDAKDGDVLATDKGGVFIYAKVLYNKPYAYCGVDKFGVFKDNCLNNNWANSVDNIHPATKEQRDLLFQKMKEEGYEWDGENKELKKIDTVQPKFHEGDWVVYECGEETATLQITRIVEGTYEFSDDSTLNAVDEDTLRLWNISDAKDGDVLAFSNDTIVIFKNLYNSTTFHSYCHIEDGVFNVSKDDVPDWWEGKGFYPATKEQREILMKAMTDEGYQWDAEKKELKKIEESENIKNQIMSEITDLVKDYIRQKSTCDNEDGDIIIFSK